MKKCIVILLIFIPLQIALGQDKIITIQNDTILCRIVSFSPTHIQYEQNVDGYIVGKFIQMDQVSTYLRSTSPAPAPTSTTAPASVHPPAPAPVTQYVRVRKVAPKPAHRWMIGIHPGRASQLASTADDEKAMIEMGIPKWQAAEYNKKLSHGWNFGGDIHYMISDNFGLGAKYMLFASSVQKDFTVSLNYSYLPEFVCVGMNEKEYIHYVGPSVIFRQWLNKNRQFQLAETLSAGYVYYRDEMRMDPKQYSLISIPISGGYIPIYNYLAEGKTWGANVGLSFDYFPMPWLSVGANVAFMYARLTKIDLSTKETSQKVDLEKKDYSYLTRFDYSLGIRFHF